MEFSQRGFRPVAFLWDRLVAFDPGLLQFRFAARVTLSVAATIVALSLIEKIWAVPLLGMMLGFQIALFSCVAVRDPTPAAQRLTSALLPLPAAASFSVAAFLSRWPLAGDGAFLVVIFAAVYARRFGPRWTAFGMIAYMTYFFGDFLHPPLAQLPDQLLGLAVGGSLAFLVQFVVLPDRPEPVLRHILQAIYSRIALVLDEIAISLSRGRWDPRPRRRLRIGLSGLNRTTLAAEEQIDAVAGGHDGSGAAALRVALLRLELATERLAEIAGNPQVVAARSFATLRALKRVQRALDVGPFAHPIERVRRAAAMAGAGEAAPPPLAQALNELREMLAALVEAAAASALLHAGGQAPGASTPLARPAVAPVAGAGGLSMPLRLALQTTLACGIAIAGGHLVSGQRWYWAVLTAFIVFTRTNSRGDSLVRGLQRTAGTLAGVVAGLLVADATTGHALLQLGLVLPCIFLAFYFFQSSYGIMSFWITIMVSLLYELLGTLSPGLLVLRVEETVLGAAAGMGVAMFVLPTRTRETVRKKLDEFLGRLAKVVEATAGPAGDAAPIEAARALDRSFQELGDVARPQAIGWTGRAPLFSAAGATAAMACAYWARELGAAGPDREPHPGRARAADTVGDDIAVVRRALMARRAPAFAEAPIAGDESPADPALRALRHLDVALRRLGRELARG